MIEISIKHNIKEIMRELTKLEREILPKATVSALNKMAARVKTQAVQRVAIRTGLQQKTIREKLAIVKAGRDRLQAAVRASPKSVNLIEFVTPGKRTTDAFRKRYKKGGYKHKGVQAKAWGKSLTYKQTFIARGKNSGKALVFSRTGPSRDSKLKAIKGPSIPMSFVSPIVRKAMDELVRSEFPKLLRHEVEWRLGRKLD